MANGPLGGFMPTPPSPGQPPQVKLETSVESRGNFNKFLGTLPKNGATAPIQTGVMQSSMPPVSPMTSNVNIFNPQMSQMTAMPMMPPAQPVQMMQFGGEASGEFSDTDLSDAGSFDFSDDTGFNDSGDDNQQSSVDDDPVAGFDFDPATGSFDVVSTPTVTQDEQEQNIRDAETFITTPLTTPPVDTRPRTNIRNVGARSNLRFDPQFTANLLQRRGLDPQGFMSPADFRQTTQGGGTGAAPTLSSALPSFGTGTGPLVREQLDRLRPGAGIAPVAQTAQGSRVTPTQLDFGLGLGLDDPFGLGFNTAGLIESARDVQRMRGPQQFVQEARSTSGVVPGARGTLPDADPLAGDVIKAIRSGAAGLPFSRNPGALKQGQENLTTEVIKSLPVSGPITQDNLAPAIFSSLDAGLQGIDRQLELYASRPNVNITNPRALANTYLGSTNASKENSKENQEAYANAIRSVAGNEFNLNDPTTRANISKAIANQEFGQAGRDVMAEMRRGTDASILDGLNLGQLALNQPLRSDVNQLSTLDPIAQTQTRSQIPDVLPDISQTFTQRDARTFSPFVSGTTQEGPGGRFTFSETPGRFIGSLAQRIPLSPDVYSEGSFDIGDTAPTLTTGTTGTAPVGTQGAGSRGDIVRPDVPISRGMQDLTGEDERLIAPEIFGTGQIAGMDESTFRSLSNEAQQKILSDIASADVGTTFTARDPEPNRGNVVGQGVPVDTVFDIDTRFDPITLDDRLTTVSPDTLSRIGREQRVDDANTFRQNVPDAARIFGGRTIDTTPTTTTNLARGPEQSIVGDDEAFAELNIGDIQGDVTQERVADILNRPDRFKDTFKIGDVEFPNLIATLANKVGTMFDRRLFDAIVTKGLDAVVDPDTGRIIGAKDEFGNLIEGRDLEQFELGDDNDPVTKFLKKATEDEKEEEKDKPPNVLGGGTPTPVSRPVRPTVVPSKFPQSTASFTPVGFDAGNLNELIARITGIRSPRRMQEGGTVAAVDRFLSSVA